MSKPLIYGLIACILLVSAPHVDHLPLWVSAICTMLLAWRGYLTWSNYHLPARWLLLVITGACVIGIAINFHSLLGREVGVTLLILLATLKLLELRSVRDATVLIYLSCFIIITNFFYSQSITTALFMLLSLLVIVTTWLHLQTGALALKPRVRIAAILLLQAIPMMLLLFVLFPRVQGPLWGMPQDAYASSGLTDTMSPGSISKLSLSDAVAFRVSFNGKPPLREQMYWRGPVLWDFDGRTWTRGHNATLQRPKLDDIASPIDYTVTLEPHNKPWLFALEMPTQISIPADFAPDFQMLNRTPVNSRLRYNVRSHLSFHANLAEPPQQLRRALALPPNVNPRARQLTNEWRSQAANDDTLVRMALTYFNRNDFSYTLEPPPLGINSVDEFLFESKQGFCEHYASAFVFLMRASGIPARIVTGYQGSEYNELGDYFIVRQSDAHAWAEVWFRDRGWVRIDPTAAIAPSRIQSGLNAALSNNAALPFFSRTQSPWLLKLRFNLDALANQWNQWVLGYNAERQFAFLTRLGMEDITWQKLAMNLLMGVTLVVGIMALIMLRHLYRRDTDAAQQVYLRFCRKLAKLGLVRAAHEGALDFAVRAAAALPQHGHAIQDVTSLYLALRYEGADNQNSLHLFHRSVARFNRTFF